MQYSLSNALSNAMPFIRSYWQLIVAMILILSAIRIGYIIHAIIKEHKAAKDYDETEIYND